MVQDQGMHIQFQWPADQLYLDIVEPSVYLCVCMEGERSDGTMNSRVDQYVKSTWCVDYNFASRNIKASCDIVVTVSSHFV